MEKKISKKLLAILMIITILSADFFMLGSSLITYATELNSKTSNSNVEFSAYFKNGENKVNAVTESIKNTDLKLYAEIKVNSDDGYLPEGATIEIENSNFKLKNQILASNTHISSIEENKVNLKQINNGETVEVELGIEPIAPEKLSTSFLSKISKVKMNGSYIYSQAEEGTAVSAEKEVSVSYEPDGTTEAELDAKIITNKVLAVKGTNKRVVQLLVKSRLTNNEYPVEETTLNVGIPQFGEITPEISVMSIDELATNGLTELSEGSYTRNEQNVQIVIRNEANTANEITWKKNAYDELVITYLYPEDVDATSISSTITSQVKAYGITDTYTKNISVEENQEKSEVIIGKTEITTEEMYKGNIYANIDKQYNTKTSIIVTNADIVDEIVVNENTDTYVTAESELLANTKYITTEINLEKMLAILGEDGNIEIKNGEETILIDKESKVNENGNVVIVYGENSTSKLVITTNKPVATGILEINHTKMLTGNTYTREQLQTVTGVKAKGELEGTITVEKEKQNIVQKSTETSNSTLELKETITKAEMTIDKTTLSTTEANEVTVGIKLITDAEKYDLYKNPTITLKMPSAVENVEFLEEPSKVYADEFGTISKNYDASKKVLSISMTGEQMTYPETSLQQTYMQLNLKLTLNSLALAQSDKIIMEYKNEKAVQYEGEATLGVIEQAVEISAPSELIKRFNLSSNENTSLTEKILQRLEEKDAGKTLDFEIQLINNKDSDISNVKVLGKLPTTGVTISDQNENTLETTLKNISAENAEIYYTENVDATADTGNSANGWTQELTTLTNAKLYLIKLDSLARGTDYIATVTVEMPNPLTENAISYTEYEVVYDTATVTGLNDNSRKIGLATSMTASIGLTTIAQVGQDILENGDAVKEGEVIKYTVTVKNNGTETFKNVQLKLDVPEGTVYVRPIQRYVYVDEGSQEQEVIEEGGYVYAEGAYYEEITDRDQLEKLTTITIPELTTTNPFIAEYEVRINKGTANAEISNKSVIIYNESNIECKDQKNIIEEANIRVTIKSKKDISSILLPNGGSIYEVYVENLSSETINDLEMEILSKNFDIEYINGEETTSKAIKIDEISPNNIKSYSIYGTVGADFDEVSICTIVKDTSNEKYRSNLLTEKVPFVNATINMTSPQNGKVIKEGDIVEYNIIVKNTSELEGVITINDVIPEYLQVQSINVNNAQKIEEDLSNYIEYQLNLKPQEQAKIDLVTKVTYIPELNHGTTITNMVTINIFNVKKENSEVITHILKSSEKVDENVENVISGYAWFDENGNGQKDVDEENLSGITVKLYDTTNQNYVTNGFGDFVQTKTDDNGEYSFAKIPGGSYLIIFEYDTGKYEFTTPNAENVDTSLNSKVSLKHINTEKQQIRVAAIEVNNLNKNVFDMNIGLKENTGKTPQEEQPGITDNPTNPDNPDNPDNPTNPEDPTNPENPGEEKEEVKTISGLAWLDTNRNGQKDENEEMLSGIKVKIYNVATKTYLTDSNGNVIETTTDNQGKYEFDNIEKGSYILIFEYDTEEYEPTTYMAEGVGTTRNSKVILNKININGQEMTLAVTDTINVQEDVHNINIGLKEKLIFDLELSKYISRVVVQNNKGTKAYDYNQKSLAKVEIHKKQLQGSLVVIEYTIKVKNNGEIAGYAKNIVDYLPNGLTFSSELNRDWYLADNNLYTKSLENEELKPGEEKEIKLILTKTMTNQNTGLINNRAEIYKDYNKYGETDIDSTPNNQVQGEDDMSSADVIIGISTGGSIATYVIVLIINMILIAIAVSLMMKNNIIKISIKKGRR